MSQIAIMLTKTRVTPVVATSASATGTDCPARRIAGSPIASMNTVQNTAKYFRAFQAKLPCRTSPEVSGRLAK